MKKAKMQDACRRKLRHPNYWSALQHARALSDDGIVIYPCRLCQYLHLGHDKLVQDPILRRTGRHTVLALLGRILKQEKLIRRYQQLATEHLSIKERLEQELDDALGPYEGCWPIPARNRIS